MRGTSFNLDMLWCDLCIHTMLAMLTTPLPKITFEATLGISLIPFTTRTTPKMFVGFGPEWLRVVSKPEKHLHKRKVSDHKGRLKEWATSSEGHSKAEVSSILHIRGKSFYMTFFQMHKFHHFKKKIEVLYSQPVIFKGNGRCHSLARCAVAVHWGTLPVSLLWSVLWQKSCIRSLTRFRATCARLLPQLKLEQFSSWWRI